MDPRFTQVHYDVLATLKGLAHRRGSQDAVQTRMSQRYGQEVTLGQVWEELLDNGMAEPVHHKTYQRDPTSKLIQLLPAGMTAIEQWEQMTPEERRKQSTHLDRQTGEAIAPPVLPLDMQQEPAKTAATKRGKGKPTPPTPPKPPKPAPPAAKAGALPRRKVAAE